MSLPTMQALNLSLKAAQQFSFSKGHFIEANVNLYCNFAKGTTAKLLWVPWVILRPVTDELGQSAMWC